MTVYLFALLLIAQPSPQIYYCEDGSLFSASFSRESASLIALGRTWILPVSPSTSGARYSDGTLVLYTKADSAFVERSGTKVFSGCIVGHPPDNTKAVVSGTAFAKAGAFLPGARFTVRLADVSRKDMAARSLAERTYVIPSLGEVSFEIPFDPAVIDPRARYSVSARVESGGRLIFTTDTQNLVITGHPNRVRLTLVSVARQN